MLSLRAHGWSRDRLFRKTNLKILINLFYLVNLGYNLRLTDIQAALLFNQVKKLISIETTGFIIIIL
ncbi:MAG: hypothetical protein CM15mP57_9440 [Alphaproteobacteria bacterium]|nr:MAG: hypothetical protein CM15mP57_9440 [Alphaproteobacteria bacterium]